MRSGNCEMEGGGGEMVNLALGAGEVVSLTPAGREVGFLKCKAKHIFFSFVCIDTISGWRGSDGQ